MQFWGWSVYALPISWPGTEVVGTPNGRPAASTKTPLKDDGTATPLTLYLHTMVDCPTSRTASNFLPTSNATLLLLVSTPSSLGSKFFGSLALWSNSSPSRWPPLPLLNPSALCPQPWTRRPRPAQGPVTMTRDTSSALTTVRHSQVRIPSVLGTYPCSFSTDSILSQGWRGFSHKDAHQVSPISTSFRTGLEVSVPRCLPSSHTQPTRARSGDMTSGAAPMSSAGRN